MPQSIYKQIGNALALVGWAAAIFFWTIAAVLAALLLRDPDRFIGGLCLGILVCAILVATAQRWISVLPGLLIYAAIAGAIRLLIDLDEGEEILLYRVLLILFFIASAVIASLGFEGRALCTFERLLVSVFVAASIWSMFSQGEPVLWSLAVAIAALLVAAGSIRMLRAGGSG